MNPGAPKIVYNLEQIDCVCETLYRVNLGK